MTNVEKRERLRQFKVKLAHWWACEGGGLMTYVGLLGLYLILIGY